MKIEIFITSLHHFCGYIFSTVMITMDKSDLFGKKLCICDLKDLFILNKFWQFVTENETVTKGNFKFLCAYTWKYLLIIYIYYQKLFFFNYINFRKFCGKLNDLMLTRLKKKKKMPRTRNI